MDYFSFTIPLIPDEESLLLPEDLPQLSDNTSILVVDDQIMSLRFKVKANTSRCKNIDIVTSGKMALNK